MRSSADPQAIHRSGRTGPLCCAQHLRWGSITMTKRLAALALLGWMAIGPAAALNLAGTEIAPMIRASEQSRPWPLVGSAMIHRSFIPFYALALHAPAEAVAEGNLGQGLTPLQITLVWYATALPKEQVQDHFRKLFESVSDEQTLTNSGPRLEKFLGMLPAAERGHRITFLYTPDGGTQVGVEGGTSVQFAGIEFNRALLSMWLGPKADPDVLAGLSGKAPAPVQ
jgi:hypothetical protein